MTGICDPRERVAGHTDSARDSDLLSAPPAAIEHAQVRGAPHRGRHAG